MSPVRRQHEGLRTEKIIQNVSIIKIGMHHDIENGNWGRWGGGAGVERGVLILVHFIYIYLYVYIFISHSCTILSHGAVLLYEMQLIKKCPYICNPEWPLIVFN